MQNKISYALSSVFHELHAGNPEPFGGEPVNFAHFGCGESFHRQVFREKSEHPAATDVDYLTGDIFRFF